RSFRVSRQTYIGNQRGEKLECRRAEEVVTDAAGPAAVTHDPRRNRRDVLLFRPAETPDPVEHVEPGLRLLRVDDADNPACVLPMPSDHGLNLARWIENDQRPSPFQRRWDCDRCRFEPARSGEDNT